MIDEGDIVEIAVPLGGFEEYGLKKGSIGIVKDTTLVHSLVQYRAYDIAFQVNFIGVELTMRKEEIRKVRSKKKAKAILFAETLRAEL